MKFNLANYWWTADTKSLGLSKIILIGLSFSALHIGMVFLLTQSEHYVFQLQGNTWFFYPPAFVRLAAFLILGFWSVPFIFFAQLILNPFGFEWLQHAFLALTTAGGAPLGAALAARALGLTQNLSNLNGLRLLLISLFAGLFNALTIRLTLSLQGVPEEVLPDMLSIMIGDTIGAWTIIYLIKITLTWRGRAARHF